MKLKRFLLFLVFIPILIVSCNKTEDTTDPLPENIIDYPELVGDWEWQHTVNQNTGDTLWIHAADSLIITYTYTYTSDGSFYSTEDGNQGIVYDYYVTSEQEVFDGDTCNRMYLYFDDNLLFDNYFYLPSDNVLIIFDGNDYVAKGTYFRIN